MKITEETKQTTSFVWAITWIKIYRYEMNYDEWKWLRNSNDLPKNPKP